MKKTLVLAILIALCAFLCVSCDVFPLRLKGTYIPVGSNYTSAPYVEFLFKKGNNVEAVTTVGRKRMTGQYRLDKGHISFIWDNGDFDRYTIEKVGGVYHGDFWLDGKYQYTQGSYGKF